jgi:hypothetical protein
MKSPDGRECSTFVRHKKIALTGKKTAKFYLLNSTQRRAEKIEVDGCAITEGKRCDWLVLLDDKTSKEEIYVELKGSAVYDAPEQLRASIERLSNRSSKSHKRCFVVFSRNPMIGTDVQKFKVKFWKTFKASFDLVRDGHEFEI